MLSRRVVVCPPVTHLLLSPSSWMLMMSCYFLLFGVARLMMRTVTKFCSLVVEEIHLIATDESPHWNVMMKRKSPVMETQVLGVFDDFTAYYTYYYTQKLMLKHFNSGTDTVMSLRKFKGFLKILRDTYTVYQDFRKFHIGSTYITSIPSRPPQTELRFFLCLNWTHNAKFGPITMNIWNKPFEKGQFVL